MALIRMSWAWLWSRKVPATVIVLELLAVLLLVFTEAVMLAVMYAVVGLCLNVFLGSSRKRGRP